MPPEKRTHLLTNEGTDEADVDNSIIPIETESKRLSDDRDDVKSVLISRGIPEDEADSQIAFFQIELYQIFDTVEYTKREIESGILDRNPNLIPIEALLQGEALLKDRFDLPSDYLEEFVS